jgi:hypothetical protein
MNKDERPVERPVSYGTFVLVVVICTLIVVALFFFGSPPNAPIELMLLR